MRHHKTKLKRIIYLIEGWNTSTLYDIFRNQSSYPTLCLLLEISRWNNHCITVFGICIFDYNFEVMFPLAQDCLNYTCRVNDTDVIIFIGVVYVIIAVTPKVVQKE